MATRNVLDRALNVHLWSPSISEFGGGIQVYSRFFAQALECVPKVTLGAVLTKHDRQRKLSVHRTTGRLPSPFRTAGYACALAWRAFRSRPDLIITTHANFTRLALVLKRWFGIPYWAVAHGVEVWGEAGARLRPALASAGRILCISRHTRDRMQSELQLPPGRFALQPDTFDAERFSIGPAPDTLRRRYGFSPQTRVIFTLARLAASEGYKGCDRIIAALPCVAKSHPDVRYLIGGSGDDVPRLKSLAVEHGVENRVIFAGFVEDHELADHFRLCDVHAMPSTGEGFGIVFLEAAACGKPSLGGNRDGSVDALLDGDLGLLVDPLSVDAVASGLIRLLSRDQLPEHFFQPNELRDRAVAAYGIDKFLSNLTEHIRAFNPVHP